MNSPDPIGALWARTCLCAEDAYDLAGPAVLEPPLDPRLAADWTVCGYLTALDAFWRKGPLLIDPHRRFYGWLLESAHAAGQFVAVIRGTDGWEEWIEDLEGDPTVVSRFPGRVEAGFVGIYESMMFSTSGSGIGEPLLPAIAELVGESGRLTIVGHSLGACLATYFAFEAAPLLKGRVAARLVASPHPGDGAFCGPFGERVPDHMMWRNLKDRVPEVPVALGYGSVPKVTELVPDAAVLVDDRNGTDLAAQHHATTYMALMLRGRIPPASLLPIDAAYTSCLSFPE